MKTKVGTENKFQPVEVVITLETQEELDKFAGVFNHSALCDFLKTPELPTRLSRVGADVSLYFGGSTANEILRKFTACVEPS